MKIKEKKLESSIQINIICKLIDNIRTYHLLIPHSELAADIHTYIRRL